MIRGRKRVQKKANAGVPAPRASTRESFDGILRTKAVVLGAVVMLSGACRDAVSPARACAPEMAAARRSWGEPFNIERSGDDALRLEVWDFHNGDNILRYRFRWGTLTEGCSVEAEVIPP
jgi:hypothetical protein